MKNIFAKTLNLILECKIQKIFSKEIEFFVALKEKGMK